jgi:hypothetical protein
MADGGCKADDTALVDGLSTGFNPSLLTVPTLCDAETEGLVSLGISIMCS